MTGSGRRRAPGTLASLGIAAFLAEVPQEAVEELVREGQLHAERIRGQTYVDLDQLLETIAHAGGPPSRPGGAAPAETCHP